ncbi:hypothetical protein MRX96_044663 [Rhipicephalus microplus]
MQLCRPARPSSAPVRQSNARELWVFLPEGICSVFVALGLTLSDGTVQQGYALSVERLRAVDKVKALVSVDYSVLISSTDRFKNSLNDFMRNVPCLLRAQVQRH